MVMSFICLTRAIRKRVASLLSVIIIIKPSAVSQSQPENNERRLNTRKFYFLLRYKYNHIKCNASIVCQIYNKNLLHEFYQPMRGMTKGSFPTITLVEALFTIRTIFLCELNLQDDFIKL